MKVRYDWYMSGYRLERWLIQALHFYGEGGGWGGYWATHYNSLMVEDRREKQEGSWEYPIQKKEDWGHRTKAFSDHHMISMTMGVG